MRRERHVTVGTGERHPSGWCSNCWNYRAPPGFAWCTRCFFRPDRYRIPCTCNTDGAPVPTTHTCPCGCGRDIAHNKLACAPGWYRLPKDLRLAIRQAYLVDRARHMDLVVEACAWYAANPAVT